MEYLIFVVYNDDDKVFGITVEVIEKQDSIDELIAKAEEEHRHPDNWSCYRMITFDGYPKDLNLLADSSSLLEIRSYYGLRDDFNNGD